MTKIIVLNSARHGGGGHWLYTNMDNKRASQRETKTS